MRLLLLLSLGLTPCFADRLSHCRQVRKGEVRGASWQFDGRGGASLSIDARSSGSVSLLCRFELPEPTRTVTLRHKRLLLSFQPNVGKGTGSGLQITAGACRIDYLRVAGEDWLEAGEHAWILELPVPEKRVEVELRGIDASAHDPLRIDLGGVSVVPGADAHFERCPTIVAGEATQGQQSR